MLMSEFLHCDLCCNNHNVTLTPFMFEADGCPISLQVALKLDDFIVNF